MGSYRVLLADDHTMFRQGLKRILLEMTEVEVIGEASDGLELLNLVKELTPDMVILDILMPNLRGIEAIPEIRKIHREAKVLILTMYSDIEFLHQAISAGADGYLVKGDAESDMFSAIEAIRHGKIYVSPLLNEDLTSDWVRKSRGQQASSFVEPLTKREREVLKLLADGKSYKEVADLLFISVHTVVRHRTNIMEKLNLKKTSDLIKYAVQKGYA